MEAKPVDKRPDFDYPEKSLGACYRPQVEPTTLACLKFGPYRLHSCRGRFYGLSKVLAT